MSLQHTEPEEDLRNFRRLNIIRDEVSKKARNVLVAGTGDQKALWQKGGIFTDALVRALKGDADYNHDGLLQFDEVAFFVKEEVRAKAAAAGVLQLPKSFTSEMLGGGNILFIRQN